MQTETLEKSAAKITPYNEVAELIDREIHAKTLEQINVLAREYDIRNPSVVAAFLSVNISLIDLLEVEIGVFSRFRRPELSSAFRRNFNEGE